jgi:uncharacterized membrane protein YcaP (DUF421 family)
MDWGSLFQIHVAPLELIARGTLMYWFLFLTFRFILHRDVGSLGVADVLLVVLIADAAQNAMSGGYETVAEGVVLVSTLIGWNYLLDWASYRWEFAHRLAEPPPLLLIRRGRILHRNLRREFITREELMAQLRANGVDSAEKVRSARMESDGTFTVLKYDGDAGPRPAKPRGVPGA